MGIGVDQREQVAPQPLVSLLRRPRDVHALEQRDSRIPGGRHRGQWVPEGHEMAVHGQRVQAEEQGLGPGQRPVRAYPTALAERHEPGGAGLHVAARVAEGERGHGEVGEQVDALQVDVAHRLAVRAFVQGPQRRRGAARPCRTPGSGRR